ncbi:MAG: DNA gyrase inhibitor YacG [Alphaproteobacteria bacterium]|nr:DNA gyrase inhibitor YacG [Alphaproteobacteria bacterium]
MSEIAGIHYCPICRKIVTDDRYAPFCSKRCADIDLGKWFDGSYAVPLEEPDELEIAELNMVVDSVETSEK